MEVLFEDLASRIEALVGLGNILQDFEYSIQVEAHTVGFVGSKVLAPDH